MQPAQVVYVERTMPPHASSVAGARALMRELVDAAAVVRGASDEADAVLDEGWVESAQLAVSEVVTNALVHAGTAVHVQAVLHAAVLRVEVSDGSRHLPAVRGYSLASGTGRGLHLVDEAVDEWGAYPTDVGKVVWFELRSATEEPSLEAVEGEGSAPETAGPPRAIVAVEFLHFPLLMHAAWQEHASALLREMLLVSLEEDDDALQRHAAASDALNVLHEQIPAPELPQDPELIMTTATEPGVSLAAIVVEVPRGSVPHFQTLDVMLTDAAELARAGLLLAPPTQPEVADMRRWLCHQVEGQSQGASPQPWSSETTAAAASHPRFEWDTQEVSDSVRALLAADGDGVIVAVSHSAAQFLGYQGEDDLRGQRLLRIIPARYHQAHIAGITLHLTNGRAPLLGQRVTVPVIRSDGSEARADLLVEPRLHASGERSFVAEFFLDAA